MRLALALLVASILFVPGLVADDAPITPLHEECSDDLSTEQHTECHEKESPGIGLLATLGVLGALAFVARRRNA